MIKTYPNQHRILIAVDCVIFGFDQEKLKLLLIKRDFEPEKGRWSLMGGFLEEEENLDDAAKRVLSLLTGLTNVYLEQLQVFSEVNRDPVERTISTTYYALINIKEHDRQLIKKDSAEWFEISKIPSLIFDHNEMVSHAIDKLRQKINIEPIGFELLPEKFTMRQLRKLHEAIQGRELDPRNFTRKIEVQNLLIKLDEKDKTSSKKGSFLYKKRDQKVEIKTGKGLMAN